MRNLLLAGLASGTTCCSIVLPQSGVKASSLLLCRYRDRGQYDTPPPNNSYRGFQPPTEGSVGSDGGNGNGSDSGSNPNGGGGMDNFTKALIAGAFIMGMGTGRSVHLKLVLLNCAVAHQPESDLTVFGNVNIESILHCLPM